jgi:hypothetical protein
LFDVSHSILENKFAELPKPRSRSDDIAVFAPKSEKRRFDIRPLMVRRFIEQDVVCDGVPAELVVLDHRLGTLRTEFIAKKLSVVAFVFGQNTPLV